MIKVLFVCMGNICRSPTAEGVFRVRVKEAGLDGRIGTDSAGTGNWHVGEAPDPRARSAASGRGYPIDDLRARQVVVEDFAIFDLILAMDRDNLRSLMQICPGEYRHKVKLFLEFSSRFTGREVPDPYFGGHEGFDQVLDMVEDAAAGLLEALRRS